MEDSDDEEYDEYVYSDSEDEINQCDEQEIKIEYMPNINKNKYNEESDDEIDIEIDSEDD